MCEINLLIPGLLGICMSFLVNIGSVTSFIMWLEQDMNIGSRDECGFINDNYKKR